MSKAPFTTPVRRLLLAGGFAVTIAAAPVVALFSLPAGPAAPIAGCPHGEVEDLYTDVCTPEVSPNQPGGVSYSTPGDPSSVPEIDGVPCTGHNTGQCIGLSENQSTYVAPHSTLSSSP